METLSFILGIAFIVVIAVAVVAIFAFVKVLRIANDLQDLQLELNNSVREIYGNMNKDDGNLRRRIDDLEREVFSQLDSRLDKLENRLMPKEAFKNKTN